LTFIAGLVLGALYGALVVIVTMVSDGPETTIGPWIIAAVGYAAIIGSGFGVFVGGISGLAAGLITGVVTAVGFFPLTESNVRRFRRTLVVVSVVSTAAAALVLVALLLGWLTSDRGTEESGGAWMVLLLLPGLIAGLGGWWVGGIVAGWYEGDTQELASQTVE
jgi:hypothetical protein